MNSPKTLPKLSGSYFNLLTPGNPKTLKGLKRRYMTFILHFAPGTLSGFNVCPRATKGCLAACLNTAGRGGMAQGVSMLTLALIEAGTTNAIQRCRVRRTQLYFTARDTFMAQLVSDIRKAIAWCAKHDLTPVFRLNGTSDIRWELATFEGKRLIADLFPTIQFYDYTKLTNRRNIPANYDLTYSLAEDNALEAMQALAEGRRVAAVFRTTTIVRRYIETGLNGFDVVDGDDSDLRFLEPHGVVVALYAKGNAKKDTSGFVID